MQQRKRGLSQEPEDRAAKKHRNTQDASTQLHAVHAADDTTTTSSRGEANIPRSLQQTSGSDSSATTVLRACELQTSACDTLSVVVTSDATLTTAGETYLVSERTETNVKCETTTSDTNVVSDQTEMDMRCKSHVSVNTTSPKSVKEHVEQASCGGTQDSGMAINGNIEHVAQPSYGSTQYNTMAINDKMDVTLANRDEVKDSVLSGATESAQEGYYDDLEKYVPASWAEVLKDEFTKPYWLKLKQFLNEQYRKKRAVFPPKEKIFAAFEHCPFESVRVVIVGQDPYWKKDQAEGLCFSVSPGQAIPCSLQNIFLELGKDIPGFKTPRSGSLVSWAKQGVLLINATLTVTEGVANSHKDSGWQHFTDAVVNAIDKRKRNIAFLLWGAFAQAKCSKLNKIKHKVFMCAHPSGYSVSGFFGCKHFSRVNAYLKSVGVEIVNWILGGS